MAHSGTKYNKRHYHQHVIALNWSSIMFLRKWFWTLCRSRPSSHPEGCFAVQKKTLQFFFQWYFFAPRDDESKKSRYYRGPSYNIYSRAAMRFFLTPDKWCPKSFSLSKNDCERRSKQIYEIVKWRHFYQFFQKVLLLTVNPIIDINLVDEKTYMRSIINSYTNKHYTTQLAQ